MSDPKYIDAEAFKRRIILYGIIHEGDRTQIPFYKHHFAEAYVSILRWVCEEVDDTPTADVIEVVRCGECKFYTGKYCHHKMQYGLSVTESDYCSKGERKNE